MEKNTTPSDQLTQAYIEYAEANIPEHRTPKQNTAREKLQQYLDGSKPFGDNFYSENFDAYFALNQHDQSIIDAFHLEQRGEYPPENNRGKPPHVYTARELAILGVEAIFVLYALFPIGISMLVGASDSGKSMILRLLGLCASGGRDFLGRKFNGKHRSAIIVSTEDDSTALGFFVNRQNLTTQLNDEELERLRFITDTADIIKKLDEELIRQPADMVILDALGDLFNGKDLNQNNQVRAFLNEYSQLANKHCVPIVFLHHTSKRSEELAPSKNNSIGSQGIEAKSRLVLELRQSKQDENIRHLCIVKGNYLPAEAKTASYDLRMDENFCFSDTGARTEFDQLSANASGKPKPVKVIEDEEYQGFLMSIYTSRDNYFSGRVLAEKVMARFGIADRKARQAVDMFVQRRWIANKSKVKSRKEYHLRVEEMNPMF